MAHIIFFTKLDCLSGMRQQNLLKQAGHEVEVRSILHQQWTPEELRTFFGELPVKEWFNPDSPRVKSGEIDPLNFDETSALAAMVADKLLIRRPLLQIGSQKRVGLDNETLDEWLGITDRYCMYK
jgi:nitrogenase-associated protein